MFGKRRCERCGRKGDARVVSPAQRWTGSHDPNAPLTYLCSTCRDELAREGKRRTLQGAGAWYVLDD